MTSGLLSDPFCISNGTRQGWPLSPLIFALVMEPLAQSIRDNPFISGITASDRTHKIGLYADYVIISLTDPVKSLPELPHTLDLFSMASFYRINFSKSSMLGIGFDQRTKNYITAHTFFSWTPNSILKYLGIQLITPSSRLRYINFNNLLSKHQKTVQNLQHTPVSWAGKIALAKIYLLPPVLYMFRSILIPFLKKQLLKLQSIITTFIWGGKHSCLKSNTLSSGGMGAPDILAYYKATILDQAKVWWNPMQQTPWFQIESVALASHPKQILSALLLQNQGTHTFLDTIISIIKTWKATIRSSKGIPLCFLSNIPLEALHTLTSNINFSDWTTVVRAINYWKLI